MKFKLNQELCEQIRKLNDKQIEFFITIIYMRGFEAGEDAAIKNLEAEENRKGCPRGHIGTLAAPECSDIDYSFWYFLKEIMNHLRR